jgi:large subunit ribosomal protein L21
MVKNMFAIIKTGGKQYKIKKGDEIRVEKIKGEKGDKIEFDKVLLLADEKARKVDIGRPYLKEKKVEAKILEQGRSKKVTVIKYKPKSRYRRKVGYKQPYTKVKIVKIITTDDKRL